MKGFVGANDYNLESNLAGKSIRLEKGEVSSFCPFQVILGSDSIRPPIDERALILITLRSWVHNSLLLSSYSNILIIISEGFSYCSVPRLQALNVL